MFATVPATASPVGIPLLEAYVLPRRSPNMPPRQAPIKAQQRHSECGRMRLCRNEDTRYTKWDLSTGGYKFTVSRVTNVISGETCRSRSCDKSWSVDTITVCRFAINGLSTSTKKVAKGASHMPLKLQMGLDAIGNLWASARMRKVPV